MGQGVEISQGPWGQMSVPRKTFAFQHAVALYTQTTDLFLLHTLCWCSSVSLNHHSSKEGYIECTAGWKYTTAKNVFIPEYLKIHSVISQDCWRVEPILTQRKWWYVRWLSAMWYLFRHLQWFYYLVWLFIKMFAHQKTM